jgi:hypothetical protein
MRCKVHLVAHDLLDPFGVSDIRLHDCVGRLPLRQRRAGRRGHHGAAARQPPHHGLAHPLGAPSDYLDKLKGGAEVIPLHGHMA